MSNKKVKKIKLPRKSLIKKVSRIRTYTYNPAKRLETEYYERDGEPLSSDDILELEKPIAKNFIPDKEFLAFAEKFSVKFRNLKPGIYKSKKDKYKIEYLKDFSRVSMNVLTDVRVGRESGTIQISEESVLHVRYTNNYMFFILLWCTVVNKV